MQLPVTTVLKKIFIFFTNSWYHCIKNYYKKQYHQEKQITWGVEEGRLGPSELQLLAESWLRVEVSSLYLFSNRSLPPALSHYRFLKQQPHLSAANHQVILQNPCCLKRGSYIPFLNGNLALWDITSPSTLELKFTYRVHLCFQGPLFWSQGLGGTGRRFALPIFLKPEALHWQVVPFSSTDT